MNRKIVFNSTNLIPPHGGTLVDLLVGPVQAAKLKEQSHSWASWELTPRQLCDLELLLNGGFSPLRTFLNRADYESVCRSMRLADGALWPIPITLDVPERLAEQIGPGADLMLRDPEGVMLAALHVEELWRPDRSTEAQHVFGSDNPEHPGVRALLQETHPWYLSGRLEGIESPVHYDFQSLRSSPGEVRAELARRGWRRVLAFQPRDPMRRSDYELALRAATEADVKLLIHLATGVTEPGDPDHYTRVRCCQAVLERYPKNTARLALLPLAARMAGPREDVWHALIHKNFGCTHFFVRRDLGDSGRDSREKPFFEPHNADKLIDLLEREIGVQAVPSKEVVDFTEINSYVPENRAPAKARLMAMSEAEWREQLDCGAGILEWFAFPEVAQELARRHPPRDHQGVTVFFTGLSGAGKSTIARILQARLLERGSRRVTLLDGDVVRKHLSSELGFSREHRDLNIRRIGWVASEITKYGGIAICAPIAPYDETRREARAMVERWGTFVLVYVATPLAVCEQRDRKGLYAKARAGSIPQFTGVSDPYVAPSDAELVIDTSLCAAENSAQQIVSYLEQRGHLVASDTMPEELTVGAGSHV